MISAEKLGDDCEEKGGGDQRAKRGNEKVRSQMENVAQAVLG